MKRRIANWVTVPDKAVSIAATPNQTTLAINAGRRPIRSPIAPPTPVPIAMPTSAAAIAGASAAAVIRQSANIPGPAKAASWISNPSSRMIAPTSAISRQWKAPTGRASTAS